ncbi:putative uncharacterized protein [Ruminococcus sp. CAG:624]|nr:putative uncharacterized protein [Ruminococcus sp. CAG:624]
MEELPGIRTNNAEIKSFSDFCCYNRRNLPESRSLCFVRLIGYYSSLAEDVEKTDCFLSGRTAEKLFYLRTDNFPKLNLNNDIDFYSKCYEAWIKNNFRDLHTKYIYNNSSVDRSIQLVRDIFLKFRSNATQTIERNFCIKLMFWLDCICEKLSFKFDSEYNAKIIFENVSGIHEYLFCYLLALIDFDILLIQCEKDIDSAAERLHLSSSFVMGEKREFHINAYDCRKFPDKTSSNIVNGSSENKIKIILPERPMSKRNNIHNFSNNKGQGLRCEKSIEELAKSASSVVLIAIHNEKGEVIGSGSGIMIGRSGFILTNNHVARGGMFYSVKIEDDDRIYETDEIVKYNTIQDLAVIKIEHELVPLKFYHGEKLARGQRVVAIGSPLGLFNTVSDGIISGFRTIDCVEMIQYTAPTSHGSSGGALLNMYGEVIGISTAGIDSGQNINLAVSYKFINDFINGFIY